MNLYNRWTVEVRHGRGWRRYPMEVPAATNLDAVRDVRRAWGRYAHCRVRWALGPDPWVQFWFRKTRSGQVLDDPLPKTLLEQP